MHQLSFMRRAYAIALATVLALAVPVMNRAEQPRDLTRPFTRTITGAIPTDLAVTDKGWVYMTGITRSPEFQVTAGAYDTTCGTDGRCNPTQGRFGIELRSDNVLMVFDPDGELHYATFLGGSSEESGMRIALARDGSVWLAGPTNSIDFEKQSNAGSCAGSSGTAVWVGRFDVALRTLQDFQCVLRSASIADLALDDEGHAWITGTTGFDNLPVRNAWQPRPGGQIDMYVLELWPGILAPRSATYIGGNSIDSPSAIAIAPDGAVLITGSTTSTNFPVVRAFQSTWSGPFPWGDAVLVSLDRSGRLANFSTLIGGTGDESGGPLTVDANGNIFIAMRAASDVLPTAADAYDRRCGTGTSCGTIVPDVYVAKFSATGAMLGATYLGGTGVDYPRHLSLFPDGSLMIGGSTQSADFPIVRGMPTNVTPAVNTETGFLSFFDATFRSLTQSTFVIDEAYRAPTQVIAQARDFTYVAGQINLAGQPGTYLRKLWRLKQ